MQYWSDVFRASPGPGSLGGYSLPAVCTSFPGPGYWGGYIAISVCTPTTPGEGLLFRLSVQLLLGLVIR
jgi:hypothetical protein